MLFKREKAKILFWAKKKATEDIVRKTETAGY